MIKFKEERKRIEEIIKKDNEERGVSICCEAELDLYELLSKCDVPNMSDEARNFYYCAERIILENRHNLEQEIDYHTRLFTTYIDERNVAFKKGIEGGFDEIEEIINDFETNYIHKDSHKESMSNMSDKFKAVAHNMAESFNKEHSKLSSKLSEAREELKKQRDSRSKGGKHSPFMPYEEIIIQVIDLYFANRELTQETAIKKIEENILSSSGRNLRVQPSTFNHWLKTYKKNNRKYIFKKL